MSTMHVVRALCLLRLGATAYYWMLHMRERFALGFACAIATFITFVVVLLSISCSALMTSGVQFCSSEMSYQSRSCIVPKHWEKSTTRESGEAKIRLLNLPFCLSLLLPVCSGLLPKIVAESILIILSPVLLTNSLALLTKGSKLKC